MDNQGLSLDSYLKMEANVMAQPSATPPISLVNWGGNQSFSATVNDVRQRGSKWHYSEKLQKMYTSPGNFFPITITFHNTNLFNLTLVITPVFKKSKDIGTPVVRCPNCRLQSPPGDPGTDHVFNIQEDRAIYQQENGRYCIVLPLNESTFGYNERTIWLKTTCFSSCINGPSKRPFVIHLSMRNGEQEIGRHIFPIKSCTNPSRDMNTDESKDSSKQSKQNVSSQNDSSFVLLPQAASNFRCPPPIQNYNFTSVSVPVQFEREVKQYINLLAVDSLKPYINPSAFPFPDES